MSRNQTACCPGCGGRIPFKKFLLLNNFSAANCDDCNARMEISNRTSNAIIAGVSGVVSATAVILGAYVGQKSYDSLIGGLFSGVLISTVIITVICMYAYRHSKLNRIHLD